MSAEACLTVAIPTWNRAAKLDACLERVSRWIERSSQVVLRVHDNASTDHTQEVIEKWRTKFDERIVSFRHPSNCGLIGNFISCLEKSETKYVWVMGDDDEVGDHALELVLSAIDSKPEPGLVALNYQPVDGVTGRMISESALPPGIAARFPNSQDCFEACFREHYGSLMFITACVFNKAHAMAAVRAYPEGSSDLALPFYVSGACAATAPMLVVEDVVFKGVYAVGSWKSRGLEVFHIRLPLVLVRLIDQYGYGKGLLASHLARYPGILYRPSRYFIRHFATWQAAIKVFRQIVDRYRAFR